MNKQAEYQPRWRERNPDYQKVYNRQHTFMVGGRRIVINKRPRPDTCEVCGKAVNKLDYHHWDNNNPHLGLWLCWWCHRMAEGLDKGLHTTYFQRKAEVNI